ncbi:hypothetical protein P0W64_02450 [Tsukamurella sp. 8F]|uniref:hypothetical protein n=1 Tax=unclassified Tsukamurella TaxID=2633480 RepID=UPI0023BA110C|nr:MULTISPECIES: hypothetical protein [unclassified Tsukamurella]MDF0528667.1 hypothetical protein [Tsukamurella sp. 8J]MDF0585629.1 hypothetical protein [Tsukamurella sp. 8F]
MKVAIVVVALVVLLVACAATLFGIALVRSSRAHLRSESSLPYPSAVPASWAGSHDPEARLHRRLRDAMRAVISADAGAAQIDGRVRLMIAAEEIDRRLVAVHALPADRKAQPLAQVEGWITVIEQAATELASDPSASLPLDSAVGRLSGPDGPAASAPRAPGGPAEIG